MLIIRGTYLFIKKDKVVLMDEFIYYVIYNYNIKGGENMMKNKHILAQ